MNPTKIKDAEITICGLTFVVDYTYYSGCPQTHDNPASPAEVDILKVSVLGQPTADADELLWAIKLHMTGSTADKFGIQYTDGFDLIQQQILGNPPL